VSDIYLGCKEKLKALNEFAAKYDLSMDDILYMGDDVPDVEPMMAVGVTAAPKDAAIEVKQMVKYISNLDIFEKNLAFCSFSRRLLCQTTTLHSTLLAENSTQFFTTPRLTKYLCQKKTRLCSPFARKA
ncbi:MAG: HAD hydrolase family protein, partial [Clostridia bacterium]